MNVIMNVIGLRCIRVLDARKIVVCIVAATLLLVHLQRLLTHRALTESVAIATVEAQSTEGGCRSDASGWSGFCYFYLRST